MVLFITAFLLPFFFVPTLSVPLDISKTMLLVVGIFLAFSLYLVSVVKRGEIELPGARLLWAVVLIPAVFFISAVLSSNPHVSLVGYNLEVGTWAFVTLGFVLMFLASVLFRTRERIFYAYLGFLASFVIVAIIAFVKFFFGANTMSLGGVLQGNVVSPVGTYADLAVFFGASAVLLMLGLEELTLSIRSKSLLYAALILSVFALMVLSVSAVWIALLVFSLIFLLYTFSFGKAGVPETSERKISYSALVILIVSLLFAWNPTVSSSGTRLSDALSGKFNVTNLSVSPSLSATYQVTRPVLKDNVLLGSGPNTFDVDWYAHKPAAVNSTIFWNAPFAYGLGLLSTFVATTGVLGGLLWLAFLILYIRLGMKSIFNRGEDRIAHFLTVSSFAVSLFLWILMIFYVPSKTMFALTFFFSGLFIASASLSGVIAKRMILFRNSSRLAFVAVLLLVAALIGNVAYAYAAVKQSVAVLYYNKASVAASTGNLELARTDAIKAASLSSEDVYYTGVAQIGVARANRVLTSNASTSPDEAKAAFQAALSETIAAAQAATQVRPENYANWVSLGQLYESLVPAPLSVQGAYDSAKAAYEEAKKRNPESPEPYYLEARLEVENNNPDRARPLIAQALEKKNDYADAYYLLTQIEISANNIPEAIKNAQTLAVLQPTNSGIFFQLGLLEYTNGQYQDAATALAQALRITPDYANAKYYYGLALDKLGNHDAALAEFEDLLKTNPDNTDLPQIIANIKAGKAPISSTAEAPSKTTPPIASTQSPAGSR